MKQLLLSLVVLSVAALAQQVDAFDNAAKNQNGSIALANGGFYPWEATSSGNISLTPVLIASTDPKARPGQQAPLPALMVEYKVGDWGGLSRIFHQPSGDWVAQDWSQYTGISLWLFGGSTGNTYRFEILDNRAAGDSGNKDSAERWVYDIVDNFTGWRQLRLPFDQFKRRQEYQPDRAPNDGFGRKEVYGYSLILPSGKSGVVYLAEIQLYR